MANTDNTQLRNTVASVVREVLGRMSSSPTGLKSLDAGQAALRFGWDCTGPEFTCGDYIAP